MLPAKTWGAAGAARFLGAKPSWMAAQRWMLGTAPGLPALKPATESHA